LDLFTGGYPAPNQLATDPFMPGKVYFGQCGDGNAQGNIYSCFSDDGGESWEQITIALPITMTDWSGATVAPAESAVWEKDARGLIFASDDYGTSWNLLGPTDLISEVNQIAIDAFNPDLIYVATRGSGLWRSTDGGATWAATPFTRTTIVPYVKAHPSQENKVYFASSTTDYHINYISEDAGETWTRVDSEIEYGAPLLFTPAQPPLLYAACHFSEKLCRSGDGGQTWQFISGVTRPGALAAGTDGERVMLYIGSPGGLVTQIGTQAVLPFDVIPGRGSVLGGGVYRMTMVLPDHWVYLPLMLRGHLP
jgi:photosystem II stability/assembly factor-like uncharacterized protein